MGQFGFSAIPPSLDTSRGGRFEDTARLRYLLLDNGYDFYFDMYTHNTLFRGGFINVIAEHLSEMGYLQFGHYIIVSCYILGLVLVAYLLGRIQRLLPLIFYAYLTWVSYPLGLGLLVQVLLVLFLSYRILSILFYPPMNKVEECDYRRFVRTISDKPDRRIFVGSLNVGILLFIFLFAAILFLPPDLQKGASFLLPVVAVYIFSTVVPGVGANSTMGVLSLIFFAILGLMTIPAIGAVLLDTIIDVIRKPGAVSAIDPIDDATKVFEHFTKGTFLSIGIDSMSVPNLTRFLVGYFIVGWSFFDSFFGPGYANSVAAEIKVRGKEVRRGTAGIYTSQWVLAPAGIVLQSIMTGGAVSFFLSAFGFTIAGFVWFMVGSKIWISRGQAASLTDMRSGMDYIMGQGPSGMRQLLLNLGLYGSLGLLCIENPRWSVVVIMVGLILRSTERMKTIAVGVLTLNLYLVYAGVVKSRPFSGELEEESVPAFNPVISYNNSGSEIPRPSQTPPLRTVEIDEFG